LPSVSPLPSCTSTRPTTTSGWDFKLATREKRFCYVTLSLVFDESACITFPLPELKVRSPSCISHGLSLS
ncbi:unnamed protein product, partial [Musa acuminata var. zebrina]